MSDDLDDFPNPYNNLVTDYEDQQIDPAQQRRRNRQLSDSAVMVLRVSFILLIGAIILNAVLNTSSQVENGGLTVKLSDNPQPGESVQLDNYTFMFDDGTGAADGYIPIPIGGTAEETAQNMRDVFAQYGYDAVIQ